MNQKRRALTDSVSTCLEIKVARSPHGEPGHFHLRGVLLGLGLECLGSEPKDGVPVDPSRRGEKVAEQIDANGKTHHPPCKRFSIEI